jgi:hypothetical protein
MAAAMTVATGLTASAMGTPRLHAVGNVAGAQQSIEQIFQPGAPR